MGRLLLVLNYCLPFILVLALNAWPGGLNEFKLLVIIFVVYVVFPALVILVNIKISKLMSLSSLASSIIVFTGLVNFDVADQILGLFRASFQISSPDQGTLRIIAFRLIYYLFISLLYYLAKKDDNIQSGGNV